MKLVWHDDLKVVRSFMEVDKVMAYFIGPVVDPKSLYPEKWYEDGILDAYSWLRGEGGKRVDERIKALMSNDTFGDVFSYGIKECNMDEQFKPYMDLDTALRMEGWAMHGKEEGGSRDPRSNYEKGVRDALYYLAGDAKKSPYEWW